MELCINISNPNFIELEEFFGTTVATAIVKDYSEKAKGLLDDYYYPSLKELKKWMEVNNKDKTKLLRFSMRNNPNLSENTIYKLLKGVVHKYNNKIYITRGFTNSKSSVHNYEQIKTTFEPNLRIVRDLENKFPDRIRIIDGDSPLTKRVEIYPPMGIPSEGISGSVPDVKVREKYFNTGNIQKTSDVLKKITESEHPLSKVAERLVKYAKINDVDIVLDNVKSYEGVTQVPSAIGYYSPGDNKIHIAEKAPVGGGLVEKLILHEVLHAFSYHAIRRDLSVSEDFEKLYKAAVEKFGKYDPNTKEGFYGTFTIDEFFVALFTDSKFIKALQKEKPIDGIRYTNLFEEIINHILNYLGLTGNETLYQQSFSVATHILEYEKAMIEELEAIENYRLNEDVVIDDDYLATPMFQMSGGQTESSKASPQVVKLAKEFLERIGVQYSTVKDIVVNGIKMDANAVAKITQALVQVVEGKEAEALPEEAMHFAVAIIKQKDPKLYNQLLKEVNNYKLLNKVFEEYGTNPHYQTKDGKVDVVKIKEEAVAKVLTEVIIKKAQGFTEKPELLAKTQTLWQKILNSIKSIFSTSGFDKAAMDILSGKEIGTIKDIREKEDQMFFQQSEQDRVYNQLIETSKEIVLDKETEKYTFRGNPIKYRVSDLVKDWYDRRFKGNDLTKTEWQKAVFDLKAEKGTLGHLAQEYAFSRFVDENGYLRKVPLDDSDFAEKNPEYDYAMYELLRDNMQQRLMNYERKNPGTRFLKEIKMYNPKRNMAGTADFVAITPQGKVIILDWKFMDLNIDKYEDVPWYKVTAWNLQMTQYKLMFEQVYGVKSSNIEEAMMIPILARYEGGSSKTGELPKLVSIKIGDADPKKIEEAYLLPVALKSQKTGVGKIDALIEKLNSMYTKLSEKKALPDEKKNKAEQLNALFSAIRQMQMRQNVFPLLDQARLYNKMIESVIKRYKTTFEGKDAKSFSQKEINDFYEELETAEETLNIYANLDNELRPLYAEEESDTDDIKAEKAKFQADLNKVIDEARKVKSDLDDVIKTFVRDIIAGSENVNGILDAEKVIKGFTRAFGSTSTMQLKSIQVLYKKANRALAYAGMDTLTENRELQKMKAKMDKWAASKGKGVRNYFDIIKKKDANELIDEFKPEFYKELKKHIAENDVEWIRNNVDEAAFTAHMEELFKEEEERIMNKPRVGTQEEVDRQVNMELAKSRKLYDVSSSLGLGWLMYDEVKKFPKREIWESKEWKELTAKGNEAAKEFYDYIQRKNKEYADLGYINKKEARVFLPFVRKSLMEKVIFGGKVTIGEQFLRSISIDEGDIGFGQIDPFTGRPIDTIPKYFTQEIDGEVSTDIFRTMSLYNEMAIRYKHLNEIEAQVRALTKLERNKSAIATSYFGKTQRDEFGELKITPDNNKNAELIDNMAKAIIYGQKFIESESFDQLLGKVGDWATKINNKIGIKLFPEDLKDRQISANKLINNINNSYQLQALGLNPLSSISNLFGGSSQSIINSGKYFDKSDFISSELWLTASKMTGGRVVGQDDAKKFLAALQYFLPLTENYNAEISKMLSLGKLTQESVQDFLMSLMRNSDQLVQSANFRAYLMNSVVIDGKIVNAREYIRSQLEYQDRYKGTVEERKKVEAEFEKKVKDLIDEKGVMKLATVKDGELIIPGVERKSESVIELRRKVQQITKDALGNLSEDDVRLINLTILGKSFMIFKNWIPRQVDVRFGNLKYNNASDAYEWGRMRLLAKVVMQDGVLKSISNVINSMQATEKGVDFMRQLYEKKRLEYYEDTGKELEMTEAEFMDLVRQGLRSQIRDLAFFLGVASFYLALVALKPDDDEDPIVKNQYKFLLKATDKLRDEIMYFYDPTSIQNLISTGFFPSMRLLTNYVTLVKNFLKENYYILTENEKEQEKNFVIKYALRSFPVSTMAASYMPMFMPDMAKDLGIKMQSQSGIR